MSLFFLSRVFQLSRDLFWKAGIGDWMDPYFINALLEHWYRSVSSMADPSSPPMYFPAGHTLGYSHGLILYAPFYVALRPFLHPFQAYNLTLFLVIEVGIVCLYLIFRKFLSLSFIESLLLTAFFFTSENVVNSAAGVWSQRLSVFLIPPILLILLVSTRISDGWARFTLAGLSGLLASLLFTQDFYSAQFALFFAVVLSAPVLLDRRRQVRAAVARFWNERRPGWLVSLAAGAASGVLVFLWIYLAAYREHPAFPDDNLMSALVRRDPSRWNSVLDVARDLGAYDTLRSFKLVVVVALLALAPWFKTDFRTRIYSLWFLLISLAVLAIPLRFNDFSIWRTFVAPLPGFGVIRDPKRIIYLYELAVVLVLGLLMMRMPRGSAYRICLTLLFVGFLAADRNRDVFAYARPIHVYDRWVGAPIAVDGSCRSFFMKRASAEYTSRSDNMWTLYNLDAAFVALNLSIPTLNGYSAWYPTGWDLFNPEEAVYLERVSRWIERHRLTGVCELDVVARTMMPATLRRAPE